MGMTIYTQIFKYIHTYIYLFILTKGLLPTLKCLEEEKKWFEKEQWKWK